jgi:hypothetical protein
MEVSKRAGMAVKCGSSSKKLREAFAAPIHHVLLTVCYDVAGAVYCISCVRLDFIQPTTEVSVRLEASVNHKILSSGQHTSRTIGTRRGRKGVVTRSVPHSRIIGAEPGKLDEANSNSDFRA